MLIFKKSIKLLKEKTKKYIKVNVKGLKIKKGIINIGKNKEILIIQNHIVFGKSFKIMGIWKRPQHMINLEERKLSFILKIPEVNQNIDMIIGIESKKLMGNEILMVKKSIEILIV